MSSIYPKTVSVTPTSKLFWHEHPVDDLKGVISFCSCEECGEHVGTMYKIVPYYRCSTCPTVWHHSCIPSSQEDINHQSHPNHPLKLLLNGPPDYTDGKCSLCQRKLAKFLYHCELCNFSVDFGCVNNPPPLTIDQPKCHMHVLTIMARDVSFICNACGTHGERNPYVCPPCSLMFHRDCIELPHVININRHDHRVSHTYSLIHGDRKCGICRKKIDWRYGVYSCSKCPDYVVHPKCATHKDVWDGKELEGVLEETVNVAPFRVIEAGVINHLSHKEHNLRLIEDAISDCDESIRCVACTRPIYDEKHYKCIMECNFTLHETCANLPLQKRHGLSTKVFSLRFKEDDKAFSFFICDACHSISNGFSYKIGNLFSIDVLCASLSWFSDYECHPHDLFLTTLDEGTCETCDLYISPVLHCTDDDCKFSLDFWCATLPKKVKHKCDGHFLSLRYGVKAPGEYLCKICETLIDPKKWYYTCDECSVVCHVHCVLGDFANAKQGRFMDDGQMVIELVPNDHTSRPQCNVCGSRSELPLIFKCSDGKTPEKYSCSYKCMTSQFT